MAGAAALLLLAASSCPAGAVIVDISAGPNGWGCTTCFRGPNNSDVAPGTVVTLDNEGESGPLRLTLGAGTYSITNAATTGTFSAWNFEGFPTSANWVWSFIIGTDDGGNTATILKSDFVNASPQASPAQVAALTGVQTFDFATLLPGTSTAGFVDTLTLASTTTLDFFIDDGILSDNGGGVALDLECTGGACALASSVPEPGTLGLFASALAGLGLILGRRRRSP